MRSKKDTSFYEFTILVTPDLTNENKNRLNIFKESHKDKCNVNIIDMGDAYEGYHCFRFGRAVYYRLSIPFKLPDKDKAIYIDGDTLVCSDLQEMWNINLDNNLCGGVVDHTHNRYHYLKNFNKSSDVYINSGVLLLNCKAWRNELNINNDIKKYCRTMGKNNFIYADQDIINVVCGGRILKLPLKFMFYPITWNSNMESREYFKIYYSDEEIKEYKNPVIIHYLGDKKPWNTNTISYELYENWRRLFFEIKNKYNFCELRFRTVPLGKSKTPSKCSCCRN